MGQFGHGRKTESGGCCQYTTVPAQYLYIINTGLGNLAPLKLIKLYHCAFSKFVFHSVLVWACVFLIYNINNGLFVAPHP